MGQRPTPESIRCTATCADGSPCPGRASVGRGPSGAPDPPRWAAHGGGRTPVGAPEGSQNARTQGFYGYRDVPDAGWTIDTLVADLADRYADLSDYIGRLLDDDQTDPGDIARFFALHRVSAARLERVLQEREKTHRASGRLRTIAALAATAAAGLPAAGSPVADRSAGRRPVVQR